MKRTILIAEDEEKMGRVLEVNLQDQYRVLLAKDGEEAIEKVSVFKPDLISLDIKMPVMDGIEALKRIRERDRRLPIILCSAYGEYKQDLTTWASDAYVVKSADLTNFKSTIRKLLGLS